MMHVFPPIIAQKLKFDKESNESIQNVKQIEVESKKMAAERYLQKHLLK